MPRRRTGASAVDDQRDVAEAVQGEQTSPCGQKLDRLGWVVHRQYEIGGERIGVRTTSRAFGEWLDDTFDAYRVRSRPKRFHYSIVIDGGRGDEGTAASGAEGRSKRLHILYLGI